MKSLPQRMLFSSPPPPFSPALFRLSSVFLFHSAAAENPYNKRGGISSPYSFSSWHHHDDDGRNVKVSVWWDFENCAVPSGVSVYKVPQRITAALRANGIKGPVSITAFGDMTQLARSSQEALASSGICLTHVPNSGKNSADISLLVDLFYWASQNPPPAHLFLISGDRDFANILHRLRMNNYNILLASITISSGVLNSAATIMWQWHELLRGENLIGKHFNHPPDGVHGSWYGHYKGLLDDSCGDVEQPVSCKTEDSSESSTEPRPRPIPKAFVNRIRRVLNLYPDGIGVSELRSELGKSMDRDYFGYKKFSRLLLSMPNVLKIQRHPSGEGQPFAYGVNSHASETDEFNSNSNASEANAFKSKSPIREVSNACTESNSSEGQVPSSTIHQSCKQPTDASHAISNSSLDRRKGHANVSESNGISLPSGPSQSQPIQEVGMRNGTADSASMLQHSSADEGFFQRIWRNWWGYRSNYSNEKSQSICGEGSNASLTSVTDEKKGGSGQEVSQLNDNYTTGVHSSSNKRQSVPCVRTCDSKDNDEKSGQDLNFFKKFVNWMKFLKNEEECPDHVSVAANQLTLNKLTEESVNGVEGVNRRGDERMNQRGKEGINQKESQLRTPVLFFKDYFWKDMESFLLSPKGSSLIYQSKNREHMAQELQKNGPLILNCLDARDFSQLVDWLISEKKWVEECSVSQAYPFRLTLPAKRRYNSFDICGSNGLSSIFSGSMTQTSSRRPTENLDAKQPKNLGELKAWFLKFQNSKGSNEPEELKNLFHREFKKELDYGFYGFSSMECLFASCLASSSSSYKSPNKSKLRMMNDCKQLVSEMMKDNPVGFNISCFKSIFLQKYGYALDHEMLGYPKLASLLQMHPGVKLQSSFIVPSTMVPEEKMAEEGACNFVSESGMKKMNEPEYEVADSEVSDEDIDQMTTEQNSIWEELGPISSTGEQEVDDIGADSENIVSPPNSSSNQEKDEVDFPESSLSDKEFSDSEGESPNAKTSQEKLRSNEDSSLLQILDSWYRGKDNGGKSQSETVDGLVDCSRKGNNPKSSESSTSVGSGSSLRGTNSGVKMKPHKTYSFVSDPVVNENESTGDEKEKLIVSILGSLKKGDSRLHS